MNNLKQYNNEEIIELIKSGKVGVADIVDSGICPTCFDKQNNHNTPISHPESTTFNS